MYDMLRSEDWVPRTVRERARRMADAHETLTRQLGHAPSAHAMADMLGMSVRALDDYRACSQIRTLVSLDAPRGAEGAQLRDVLFTPDDLEASWIEQERLDEVMEALYSLPIREREAVVGFYLQGCALTDLGSRMGVSVSRVSQLHRAGVARLRRRLT
jgi:RNA polymerase sigma factor for flagellar operon FliA